MNRIAVISILVLGYHFITQLFIVPGYAKACDNRINYLEEVRKNENLKVVYVESLPDPGYLYSAEISSDTGHFTNLELRLGLKLPFSVARKKL
jgi:hypothetical protein